ncbi:A disintegrin and metalloproteinase with thrombospondin motifs 3 [Liparis tanakae]|uniref:A disintegrin and metalloproteinase with thrombospondin motifs 3 n=1 Tax=Liparis tanakae TaxID=230148 RepID=A0A4Z2HIP5_9TELE|nr:A disintegrin and metalloproteinase with thrombospondin motifs 3 [Liparis tanakae]
MPHHGSGKWRDEKGGGRKRERGGEGGGVRGQVSRMSTSFPDQSLRLAGMIRMDQEEFFIEPVERGDGVREEEEEGGGGRTHVVYRSSAVKKAPISPTARDYHSRALSLPLHHLFCPGGSLGADSGQEVELDMKVRDVDEECPVYTAVCILLLLRVSNPIRIVAALS